ncbi:diguanylate phosphodiesterase [Pseudomonas agarici]|uniref:cyclic-guanylate-specific phosphodiesterase n=1 Tax=Pseudomonas agarici TaxID=46677 RepID=A0A0X1T2A8_PSEAA|nr:EAL domain-containing protein [Pseudomonas agarici]AMB86180.1 diguanylate phosphodiesterase [Pseudomonas agarici]
MPAARETLRSWFFRPWSLALLAALISAAVLLSASLVLVAHQVRRHESEQMNAQGQRFLERLEQLFGQLREGLDLLEVQPLHDYGAQMIATLQQLSFSYRFIYEAVYIDAFQSCSNRPRRDWVASQAPDIRGPTYSYWLNTSAQPDDNLAALILGRGNFRVSTSRGHLTDVVELPPGAGLLVVVNHDRRAIPILGPIQRWPPLGWPTRDGDPLLITDQQLIYRMPTHTPEYQLVMVAPRSAMQLRFNPLWWWLLPASLLIAVCMGGLTLQFARKHQSLNGKLQGALRRGELQVLYQPIFELSSRHCVGAEALIRWRRPDGTLTSPDLFIPLAEDTGQIRQITDFVLQRLLEQLGPVLRANPQLYISVNLAACDVMIPRIGEVIGRLLRTHRVAASQIAFEVTERSLIDVAVARDNLQALRDVGHQVLIDDFGTGYCSLAYLQTLPVDCLKIDKAFIDALGHDAASSGIAPHIIRMAHSLRLQVIAEGIEDEAQALLLSSEGVNYGQGWLFARALTAVQFIEMISCGRSRGARRLDDET